MTPIPRYAVLWETTSGHWSLQALYSDEYPARRLVEASEAGGTRVRSVAVQVVPLEGSQTPEEGS